MSEFDSFLLCDCVFGATCPVCGVDDEYLEVDTPYFCSNWKQVYATGRGTPWPAANLADGRQMSEAGGARDE